jgi:hypothetical protein
MLPQRKVSHNLLAGSRTFLWLGLATNYDGLPNEIISIRDPTTDRLTSQALRLVQISSSSRDIGSLKAKVGLLTLKVLCEVALIGFLVVKVSGTIIVVHLLFNEDLLPLSIVYRLAIYVKWT